MKRSEATLVTPCGADWKEMQPRGRARLCTMCDKLVHDLSAMTEPEARRLLHDQPTEGLCIRYLFDAEGNVWFADDKPDIPRSRLVRRSAAHAAVAALVLAPLLTEACGGASPYSEASDAAPILVPAMPTVSTGPTLLDGGDGGDGADAGSVEEDDSASDTDAGFVRQPVSVSIDP